LALTTHQQVLQALPLPEHRASHLATVKGVIRRAQLLSQQLEMFYLPARTKMMAVKMMNMTLTLNL